MHIGAYCHACQAHRLHERLYRRRENHATRVIVCTVCAKKTPLGLTCPKCQGCLFKTWRTYQKPGATVRVRVCLNCTHRVRERSVIEANRA